MDVRTTSFVRWIRSGIGGRRTGTRQWPCYVYSIQHIVYQYIQYPCTLTEYTHVRASTRAFATRARTHPRSPAAVTVRSADPCASVCVPGGGHDARRRFDIGYQLDVYACRCSTLLSRR